MATPMPPAPPGPGKKTKTDKIPPWAFYVAGGIVLLFVLYELMSSSSSGSSTSTLPLTAPSTNSSGATGVSASTYQNLLTEYANTAYQQLVTALQQSQTQNAAFQKELAGLANKKGSTVIQEPYAPPPVLKGPNEKIPAPIGNFPIPKLMGRLSGSASTGTASPSYKTVRLQKGQTIWGLAGGNIAQVNAILKANNLTWSSVRSLPVGKTLKIPG